MFTQRRPQPQAAVKRTGEKPKLKATQVPVFRVSHFDLEEYITTVYGFRYDFYIATGVTEGMTLDYVVDAVLPSDEARRRAADLRNGRRCRDIRLILNTLAIDGYIPKGYYTVITTKPPAPLVVYRRLLEETENPLSDKCVKFKEQHRGNVVFMGQAKQLDQLVTDQIELNRRSTS